MTRGHRLHHLQLCLDGLSVGDAFGERFFATDPREREERIGAALDPDDLASGAPWPWTDDTAMALSVVEELVDHGAIGEARLARRFAVAYAAEPWRGYGGTAHRILQDLVDGVAWQEAASRPFNGTGSKGNGSAMRAPPIGAFFADDDIDVVVAAATASALPTHRHPDAIAGATAIAIAGRGLCRGDSDDVVWRTVLRHIGDTATRDGIEVASQLSPTMSPLEVAALVGSGRHVLCEDTVPYCLWCALLGRRLGSFPAALFATVSGLGDMDTTCAIVGGLLGPLGLADPLPGRWLAKREPLPTRSTFGKVSS
jgi:ADP-ribosylglycohydrolase